MGNIIYTITIPTYNHGERLKEKLETLIPQVRKFRGEVSILVSDDASDDGTRELMTQVLDDHADIIDYNRNTTHVGYAANWAFVARRAKGRYLCLMGDDDIMLPNHVETVVELLKSHPDAGMVNYNMLRVSSDLKNGSLQEHDIRSFYPVVYPTGKEFIYSHLDLPCQMTSNVFEREAFVNHLGEAVAGEYPGYEWFMAMYKSLLDKECVYVGFPLALQRLPMSEAWEVDEPWRQIYGLGTLFRDLDPYIPHLFEHWMEHVRNDRQEELKHLLVSATLDKRLYRERFERMKPFMISPEYAQEFWKAIQD